MLRATFGRELRLLNSRHFSAVFSDNTHRVAHTNLLLLAKPNDLGHPRLGLVIAKKHIKTAVRRNRVKRVVRDSFRMCQHDIGAYDIVFLARPGLGDLPPSNQTALLYNSWSRFIKRTQSLNSAAQ